MPTPRPRYDVVVCGAGIAGISAAHALSEAGVKRIALVEHGPVLGLTSDKSGECYRNWWPGPGDAMVAFTSRSIDLLEGHARRSGNRFLMNKRGYLYATARRETVDVFERQALEAESLGAGKLRHVASPVGYEPARPTGFGGVLDGADLVTDRSVIREHFGYLNADTVAVLHARRCGWLSAQQLGMHLLEEARGRGVELVVAEFIGAETSGGRISGVQLRAGESQFVVATDALVLASGPYVKSTAARLGATLPVVVEKHVKITMADPLGAVPRSAPLIIWCDPTELPWSAEEREALASDAAMRRLLAPFPAGVHGRPIGSGDQVFMYWTYDCPQADHPTFPLSWDPHLPEITLRGMSVLVPGLAAYLDPMPKPYVDGGYYTKTPENRPLIGPLPVPGAFVSSAYSGFGIMSSCAGGELVARHVTGGTLPSYAAALSPSRYEDPAYRKLLETWDSSGQL
ncbi:MAG: FAD-binding oxidoreductase [Alphaproteobacteria bacterium]|nr:FAD-binding oxidoreductase [Alphaproteobacteria bacterium]